MPRTPILALAACLGLSACATITGDHVPTEMVIANHTGRPITVSFAQSTENTGSTPLSVGQTVAPAGTIRFSGKEGDQVLVTAGDQPPLALIFAKRSQVVKVSEQAGEVSYDIHRGYTDPNK